MGCEAEVEGAQRHHDAEPFLAAPSTAVAIRALTRRFGPVLAVDRLTLEEVFVHEVAHDLETGGGYTDAVRTRRTARRLG